MQIVGRRLKVEGRMVEGRVKKVILSLSLSGSLSPLLRIWFKVCGNNADTVQVGLERWGRTSPAHRGIARMQLIICLSFIFHKRTLTLKGNRSVFASAVINHRLARLDDLAIEAFTVTPLSTGGGEPLCGLAYLEEVQTTITRWAKRRAWSMKRDLAAWSGVVPK